MVTNPITEKQTNEFDTLLAQSIEKSNLKEGSIIKGIITEIDDDAVIVDIAAKVEGRISKREFSFQKDKKELAVGDEIDVYLEKKLKITMAIVFYQDQKLNLKKFGVK